VFLGEEIVRSNEHSEDLSSLVDGEIRSLITRAYQKAKQLLTNNRSVLDRLANELLKHEVIAGDELDNLFKVLIPAPAA